MTVSNELIDSLLADYKKPEDLLGEHGLLKQLTKKLVERALEAEMAEHLRHARYESVANIAACEKAKIEPFITVAREEHHPGWRERFTEPEPLDADATPMQRRAHKLKTQSGRKLYALRKQTVEPVFGIIKSVMGFRQFLLRGKDKVAGEWRLVCLRGI